MKERRANRHGYLPTVKSDAIDAALVIVAIGCTAWAGLIFGGIAAELFSRVAGWLA